jgi:hypothetical protein
MKRLVLGAASAVVLGLTACSHSTAPSAAPETLRTPVSCTEQYHRWMNGQGRDVMGALNGVSSAATSGNGQALTAALKEAKPAVAQGARHPIPACADPRGYWSALLMHVNAAAASKGSPPSARAAMQDVPKLMDHLAAGVKQTAGERATKG